ncbi:MAG: hypothetical protein AAF525_01465 [Pseudomonadota bacterium]
MAATASESFSYAEIAKRYAKQALSADDVKRAEMQGECLVGLKQLIFQQRKKEFDPVAEWSNLRSISLLEQYSPCEVLIMIEVAQKELRAEQAT